MARTARKPATVAAPVTAPVLSTGAGTTEYGVMPVAAPATVAAPAKVYNARRFTPDTVIAVGPVDGKPGTVAAWLQNVLHYVLENKGTGTCTVGEWTAAVIAQQEGCPSRSKPCRGGVWAQFVTGYLRWQVAHGQVRLVPGK